MKFPLGQLPPILLPLGQLPLNNFPLDNCPPDNCPLWNSPQDNYPPDFYPPDNYPRIISPKTTASEQLLLISSTLKNISPYENFHSWNSPSDIFLYIIPPRHISLFFLMFFCWLWAFKCLLFLFKANNEHTRAKSCKLEQSFSQRCVSNNINYYYFKI